VELRSDVGQNILDSKWMPVRLLVFSQPAATADRVIFVRASVQDANGRTQASSAGA
jgi:hypothetical protein